MASKIDSANIAEVRRAARLFIEDDQVTDRTAEAEAARDSLLEMLKEATEFDLTEADVVRAVLSPLFGRQPEGCNCYTCKARRGEIQGGGIEEQIEKVNG